VGTAVVRVTVGVAVGDGGGVAVGVVSGVGSGSLVAVGAAVGVTGAAVTGGGVVVCPGRGSGVGQPAREGIRNAARTSTVANADTGCALKALNLDSAGENLTAPAFTGPSWAGPTGTRCDVPAEARQSTQPSGRLRSGGPACVR
jgi:hypothetical protein